MHDTPSALLCRPIAYARSPYSQRIDAPHQATVVAGTATAMAAEAVIEFVDRDVDAKGQDSGPVMGSDEEAAEA